MGYGIICAVNSELFDGPRLTQSIFVTEIMLFSLLASLILTRKNVLKNELSIIRPPN